MKIRYWNNMLQFRYSVYHLEETLSHYVKINRLISIALAVASSGAIATWAIWNQYPMVWAIIVALSQVGSVINSLLPYSKRISEVAELKIGLLPICDEVEYNWFGVTKGTFTDTEINDMLKNYKDKWVKVDSKYLVLDSLPRNKKVIAKAKQSCEEYLKAQFPEG